MALVEEEEIAQETQRLCLLLADDVSVSHRKNNQEHESSKATSPAHAFDLYGWKPNPTISDDENYLDVVMLITRSVQGDGQQGHMGALIVRPRLTGNALNIIKDNKKYEDAIKDRDNGTTRCDKNGNSKNTESSSNYPSEFFQNIIGAATNTPLFGGKDVTSDIHAEINALGQACRSWQSTEGCAAYITIPPCKRCFAALVAFGINRIVCRRESPPIINETAAAHDIQVSHLSYPQQRLQMQRINELVNQERTDNELMEIAERIKKQRKERKLAEKIRKHGNDTKD